MFCGDRLVSGGNYVSNNVGDQPIRAPIRAGAPGPCVWNFMARCDESGRATKYLGIVSTIWGAQNPASKFRSAFVGLSVRICTRIPCPLLVIGPVIGDSRTPGQRDVGDASGRCIDARASEGRTDWPHPVRAPRRAVRQVRRLHLSAGRALVAVTAGQTRNPPTFELALPKLALVAVAAREGDYAAAMLLAIPEILLVTVAVGVGQDAVAV